MLGQAVKVGQVVAPLVARARACVAHLKQELALVENPAAFPTAMAMVALPLLLLQVVPRTLAAMVALGVVL